MNLDGNAVAAVAGFYKINPENILVTRDKLDLEFGEVRLDTWWRRRRPQSKQIDDSNVRNI